MVPDSVYSGMVRNPKEIITPLKSLNDAKRRKRSGRNSGNALKAKALVERLKAKGW